MKKKIILFLVGFYPLYLLSTSIFLLIFGIQTTGTIIKVISTGGKNNSSMTCIVSYIDSIGEQHQFEAKAQNKYITGSGISLIYSKNFNIARTYDEWYFLGMPLMLTIFFIWFASNYELLEVEETVNRFLYGVKDTKA